MLGSFMALYLPLPRVHPPGCSGSLEVLEDNVSTAESWSLVPEGAEQNFFF